MKKDSYRYDIATTIIKVLGEEGRPMKKNFLQKKSKQAHPDIIEEVLENEFGLFFEAAESILTEEFDLITVKQKDPQTTPMYYLKKEGYEVAKRYNSLSEYADYVAEQQKKDILFKRASTIIQLIVAIFAILGVTVKDFIPEGDRVAILCWIAIGIIIGLGINNLKIWKN